MPTVTVSKKGWVVIPHEIRQRYGIRPGDRVQLVDYAGRIALIPAMKHPIQETRGMFKGGPSLTQTLLDERRRERDREERVVTQRARKRSS